MYFVFLRRNCFVV